MGGIHAKMQWQAQQQVQQPSAAAAADAAGCTACACTCACVCVCACALFLRLSLMRLLHPRCWSFPPRPGQSSRTTARQGVRERGYQRRGVAGPLQRFEQRTACTYACTWRPRNGSRSSAQARREALHHDRVAIPADCGAANPGQSSQVRCAEDCAVRDQDAQPQPPVLHRAVWWCCVRHADCSVAGVELSTIKKNLTEDTGLGGGRG